MRCFLGRMSSLRPRAELGEGERAEERCACQCEGGEQGEVEEGKEGEGGRSEGRTAKFSSCGCARGQEG